MSESSNARGGSSDRNAVMRLIIENPISAFNAAAIIFGGGFVYSSNQSAMFQINERVVRLEQLRASDLMTAAVKDDRTTLRIEGLSQSVGDIKVTVRGIEAGVQYIAEQVRQQARREKSQQ